MFRIFRSYLAAHRLLKAERLRWIELRNTLPIDEARAQFRKETS
jgi:hypothetical protein